MTLNLIAPMLRSQLVLAPMRELGGGAIVNIASSAGVGSESYGSPEYGSSKAGLIRFTSSLAGLEEPHGVRMTCIVPGWIGLDRAYEQGATDDDVIPPEDIVATALTMIEHGASGTVVEMLNP